MKNKLFYGALFLSFYFIFVVVTIPASFVFSFVNLPKSMSIQGISGSIWQSKITEISHNKVSLQKVKLSLSALSLFTLDPRLELSFGDAMLVGPEGKLTVSGLLDELTITDAEVLLSANDIVKELTLPIDLIASGDVMLTIETFVLGKPLCHIAQGRINWKKSAISALDQRISLGSLSAEIACEQGALSLVLAPKNDLGLSFTAYVRDKSMSGNGFLKPGAKFPKQLNAVLPFLGKPDNQGRYRLSF